MTDYHKDSGVSDSGVSGEVRPNSGATVPVARGDGANGSGSQGNIRSQVRTGGGGAHGRAVSKKTVLAGSQRLPNASIIYGIGASILFVMALGLLFSGVWLSFILVMFPAACLLGFAIHYIRVDSSADKPYG